MYFDAIYAELEMVWEPMITGRNLWFKVIKKKNQEERSSHEYIEKKKP